MSFQYVVERASSGRAKCKDTACKQPIQKGELRIGKIGKSGFGDEDALTTSWYHADCYFNAKSRMRATSNKIDSVDDISNFDELSTSDQDVIEQLVKDEKVSNSKRKSTATKRTKVKTVREEEEEEDEKEERKQRKATKKRTSRGASKKEPEEIKGLDDDDDEKKQTKTKKSKPNTRVTNRSSSITRSSSRLRLAKGDKDKDASRSRSKPTTSKRSRSRSTSRSKKSSDDDDQETIYLSMDTPSGGKFWTATRVGRIVNTAWGRLGNKGQANKTTFKDAKQAQKHLQTKISQKNKQGLRVYHRSGQGRCRGILIWCL